jgi:hypothetical protein
MRTKVCHYAPSSKGAHCERGENPVDWNGGEPCLGILGEMGETLALNGALGKLSRRTCGVILRDGISRWEFEGEPGIEPWDTEPRDTRDTRLNASQDGFGGETVRGNPEGRKGGRVSRVVVDPTVPHLRRCSEKDTVVVSRLAWPSGDTGGSGTFLRFHTPNPAWPSGETGGAGWPLS